MAPVTASMVELIDLRSQQRFDFRFEIFFAPGRDGRISAIFKNFGRNLTKI
jgi:hypothetical protein